MVKRADLSSHDPDDEERDCHCQQSGGDGSLP
jgi:hypothetical protein